jgi:peptide/nickel transport system substrate-binding protein
MRPPRDRMRPPGTWETEGANAHRLTRRRFLAGGAASAVAAGLTLAGCGGGGSTPSAPTNGEEPGPTRTPSPGNGQGSPTPSGTTSPPLTVTGFVFSDGQFDPHKTQVGTLHGQQAFIYSRLLTYLSQANGLLEADLAEGMPEQPDDQTFVFRLRPGVEWHNVAPVNGRLLNASDVVHSIERQMTGNGEFVRPERWNFIESVEAPNNEEVVIRTNAPFAGALSRLAEPSAFIVPPEHDTSGVSFGPNQQAGTGPFTWVEWDERHFASVRRNDRWFRGAPRVAGVTLVEPTDSATVEAMLRVRDLDVAFLGARQAEQLMSTIPDLQRQSIGNALFFGMRFYTPTPPFDDPRFRTALSIALDRREMVDFFFQGAGEPNGWVSWPVSRWALSQAELSEIPGYRLGSGGRQQDIADARALLESMRSDEVTVPTSVQLHSEFTSEEQLSLGSLIARQLWEALEISVTLEYVPIDELVDRHFRGDAPWIAGPDTGWLDLDDWVYPYFHSNGLQNSFALRNEELDGLIEQQRRELNEDSRRSLGRDIQRKLLEVNAGVNLVSERVMAVAWPYVRDFPLDITDGYQDRFARCWIDTEDPTYRRR